MALLHDILLHCNEDYVTLDIYTQISPLLYFVGGGVMKGCFVGIESLIIL